MRTVLPLADVLIGTEEECYAALARDPDPVMAGARVTTEQRARLDDMLAERTRGDGPPTVILKRGPRGVTVLDAAGRLDVGGFAVEVVNTVGAGDAFAAGLIRSRLQGLDWHAAARFANACGAIEVGRHGCSAAFPTAAEVADFLSAHGEG